MSVKILAFLFLRLSAENILRFFKNRSGKARVDQNNIKFKFSMKRWEIQDQYSATIKVLKLVGLNMVEQN